MLNKGYTVFLWQKLIEDIFKNTKDINKKDLLEIKDLNMLAQQMKTSNIYNKLKLEKYFSNDAFDKIYLNYTLYKKSDKK